MGNVGALVPADDPLMIAWKAYQATDEYANTFKWATDPSLRHRREEDRQRREQHFEGTLWAAFIEGYEACRNAEFPETEATVEVVVSGRGDAWAANLNGRLVGGWFQMEALADAIATDLRVALKLPGADDGP